MNNLPAVDNLTVQKVQTGDSGAFKDLVGMLMQPAYFHALGMLGHHEDASDVVQQAFIRILFGVFCHPDMRDGIMRLVRMLQAEGLRIDGGVLKVPG